jgi:hypothetical protein
MNCKRGPFFVIPARAQTREPGIQHQPGSHSKRTGELAMKAGTPTAPDDTAWGAASDVVPKFVSPSDPAAQWTGAHKGPAFFACSDNYLIDVKFGVIVEVEASRAIRQAEVGAAKTMIERTEEGSHCWSRDRHLLRLWLLRKVGVAWRAPALTDQSRPHLTKWQTPDRQYPTFTTKSAGSGRRGACRGTEAVRDAEGSRPLMQRPPIDAGTPPFRSHSANRTKSFDR